MLEFLGVPAILATAALWPKNKSEEKKIEAIFQASDFGIKKQGELTTPRLRSKKPILNDKKYVGMQYVYALPLGMTDSKIRKLKEDNTIGIGLQKTVEIEINDYLIIKVYDHKIPKLVHYRDMPPTKDWIVPLGVGYDKVIYHNFDYTPHMVVSGTTRFGKTVMLKNIMTRLIENNPHDAEFYIVDLKGGLEFGPLKRLKQVIAVSSNPDDTALLLDKLFTRIEMDLELFECNYWSNIIETNIKKRKFIIVDEAAQLVPERWMDKERKALLSFCQSKLCEIARVAGALGYRLIYCTQYPTVDTVPRQIKQNADAKLSFRLSNSVASKVAIDSVGAEELPSEWRGRALYKTHEIKEIQTPLIDTKEILDRLQDNIEPIIEEVKQNDINTKTESTGTNLIEFR